MDIEVIARKLEPLAPKGVAYWLENSDRLEEEEREELDDQLLSRARQYLGEDFEKQILLSLPDAKDVSGRFSLGTLHYGKARIEIGLTADDLIKGAFIGAYHGQGKTNLQLHLLRQLVDREIPILVLDFKNTTRQALEFFSRPVQIYTPGKIRQDGEALSPLPLNPFIVPSTMAPTTHLKKITDFINLAFGGHSAAKIALEKAALALYTAGNTAPSVSEVLASLNEIPKEELEPRWKLTARRSLEAMQTSGLCDSSLNAQDQMLKTLLEQNTVIEVESLDAESQRWFIPCLCYYLFTEKKRTQQRERLSLCLNIDEAHNVLHKDCAVAKPLEFLLRQCRELGVAALISDLHPEKMTTAVMDNAHTMICLGMEGDAAINAMKSRLNLEAGESWVLKRLRPGWGVVRIRGKHRKPMLLNFPHLQIAKGAMGDEDLANYLRSPSSTIAKSASLAPTGSGLALEDNETALIRDVIDHPNDGVFVRYKRLNLSVDKGHATKERLCKRGVLEQSTMPHGNTRRKLLGVSSKWKKLLSLEQDFSHESLEHARWKIFYKELLQNLGATVTLEQPRETGATDVSAEFDTEEARFRVAIEIETGSNSKEAFIHNVLQDLGAGFDRVVIISTSEETYKKHECWLLEAGLLIPGRAILRLRDKLQSEDLAPPEPKNGFARSR